MSRTDQYQIHVSGETDGRDWGIWRTGQGGGTDSNESFVRDGYGLPRKALGGPQTVDTVTASRTFYADTDNGQQDQLMALAGNYRVVYNRQKLDADGFAVGTPMVRKGVLKSCKPSDVDVSDDSPGADTYTIEISPDGI